MLPQWVITLKKEALSFLLSISVSFLSLCFGSLLSYIWGSGVYDWWRFLQGVCLRRKVSVLFLIPALFLTHVGFCYSQFHLSQPLQGMTEKGLKNTEVLCNILSCLYLTMWDYLPSTFLLLRFWIPFNYPTYDFNKRWTTDFSSVDEPQQQQSSGYVHCHNISLENYKTQLPLLYRS